MSEKPFVGWIEDTYLNTEDSPDSRLCCFARILEESRGIIQVPLYQFDIRWQFGQFLGRGGLGIARDGQDLQGRLAGNESFDKGASLLSRRTSD